MEDIIHCPWNQWKIYPGFSLSLLESSSKGGSIGPKVALSDRGAGLCEITV